MIRDPETLNLLLDSIRQFVRESLVPHEQGGGGNRPHPRGDHRPHA